MCDTFGILGKFTKDGSTIFGKNSDRDPNEIHIPEGVPGEKHDLNEHIKTTYGDLIPQVKETYTTILFKPFWIWGAEMGINENGVFIGNEAIFTKRRVEKNSGLIGMDILRISLERSKDAKEGVENIINILDKFGQGRNCGFEHKIFYHNSFLVGDRNNIFVVETVEKDWVVKEVSSFYSISNCITIGKDYSQKSKGIKEGIDFKETFENKFITYFSKGKIRRERTYNILKEKKGEFDIFSGFNLLRDHAGEEYRFNKGSMGTVCMHGGGLISSQTTGSVIIKEKDEIEIFATLSSSPCISIFKYITFSDLKDLMDRKRWINYWLKWEELHRLFVFGKIRDISSYKQERDEIENKIVKEKPPLRESVKLEEPFIKKWIQTGKEEKKRGKRSFFYLLYWKRENRKLKKLKSNLKTDKI